MKTSDLKNRIDKKKSVILPKSKEEPKEFPLKPKKHNTIKKRNKIRSTFEIVKRYEKLKKKMQEDSNNIILHAIINEYKYLLNLVDKPPCF
jgi:hypothetical protein